MEGTITLKKTLVVLALILSALLLCSGCAKLVGKAVEKAVEKNIEKETGDKVDISSDDGTMTVKGKDGSEAQVGGDINWPDKIPADVPELKNVTYTFVTTDEKGNSMLTFEKASADTISGYIDSLIAAGFTEGTKMESSDGITNTYTKDKITVMIAFTKADGTGMLTVGQSEQD